MAAGERAVVAAAVAATQAARLDEVRVLFVDDDEGTRLVVRELLERAGATVQTASSVSEARTLMASWDPSVLISDIAMPNETGYEFVRKLRASHVGVPAIALTAYARRGDAEEALAAGFQVYMAKPVQPSDLIQTVAKLTHDAPQA
jgi:CheY-like chemotaxis protein